MRFKSLALGLGLGFLLGMSYAFFRGMRYWQKARRDIVTEAEGLLK